MKPLIPALVCLGLALPLVVDRSSIARSAPPESGPGDSSVSDVLDAQPKLIQIRGTIDGSGKIACTRETVRYIHKQWQSPTNLVFGGEPWADLDQTPKMWPELARSLDLTRAWVVQREGRDTIALEQTPDGFDLYLCDSPNGSAPYEVTIAIPRRR